MKRFSEDHCIQPKSKKLKLNRSLSQSNINNNEHKHNIVRPNSATKTIQSDNKNNIPIDSLVFKQMENNAKIYEINRQLKQGHVKPILQCTISVLLAIAYIKKNHCNATDKFIPHLSIKIYVVQQTISRYLKKADIAIDLVSLIGINSVQRYAYRSATQQYNFLYKNENEDFLRLIELLNMSYKEKFVNLNLFIDYGTIVMYGKTFITKRQKCFYCHENLEMNQHTGRGGIYFGFDGIMPCTFRLKHCNGMLQKSVVLYYI